MNQPFLQSDAWQAFQKALGRTTFRRSGEGWEYLAILEHGTGHTRLYCPYGPTARDQAALEQALQSLVSLGTHVGASFVRIEPTDQRFSAYLSTAGWHKTTYQSLNPEHSHVIDLSLDEADLVAAMAQPVRNIYRNYHKKGVVIHTSHNPADVTLFLNLIHQVAQRTGMRPHSDAYFRTQATSLLPTKAATLWYATRDDQVIAASLMYDSDDSRIYAHAAASSLPEHRTLNAGTALVAEAIIDAKRHGKRWFDLYGIAPAGSPSSHPWAGFTRFKRSFGGNDIAHAGTWELPLRPLRYWLYRFYQTLHHRH